MTLNNLSNCETHEQERNVVRPDYLALSISGRKLNSQNGTKQIEDVTINDNYNLHFDVDKKEITIKNVRGGENIKVEHSYLTDIQNVLNSDMPQDQKEIERAKLDWYLAEKVILSLPKGFIEKPDRRTAQADAEKMGDDVAVQGANVPWSDKPIR